MLERDVQHLSSLLGQKHAPADSSSVALQSPTSQRTFSSAGTGAWTDEGIKAAQNEQHDNISPDGAPSNQSRPLDTVANGEKSLGPVKLNHQQISSLFSM